MRTIWLKKLIFNSQEHRIRGSFVLLFLTACIVALIFIGTFNDDACENIVSMKEIIIGLFGISFGVWEAKKYMEGRGNAGNHEISDV